MKCIILSFKNLLTIQEGINRERRIKLKDISKVKEFLHNQCIFIDTFFIVPAEHLHIFISIIQ